MRTGAILAAIMLTAVLGGCTDDKPETTVTLPVPTPVAAPVVDAGKVLDDLRTFSEAYPYRQSGTPAHLAARDDLAGRFEAAGLEVVRQSFAASGLPVGVPAVPQYDGENVCAMKWGVARDDWIVIGAHYDVTEGAVYGTYDDGSGTAIVFNLAESFAQVPTYRTLVFCEFDQEEMGLVGSTAFIQAVTNGDFPYKGNLTGMLDLDMIGITYPHAAPMVAWQNSPTLKEWTLELATETGFPTEQIHFRPPLGGSSDGAAFIGAGVPTIYFWSDWDDWYLLGQQMPYVGIYVGAYPWWHKLDTYDTMVLEAGSDEILHEGFQNVLDIVSPLLQRMSGPVVLEIES